MSVLAVADPLAAVCAYLRAMIGGMVTLTPAGLVQIPANVPAIFRPDLPRGFQQMMPTACIVVRHNGGVDLFGKGFIPWSSPRLDIVCYGANARQAADVAQAAMVSMKRLMPSVWANTLLHAANISNTPIPSFQPNTLFPMSEFSVQLIHAEDPVTP